MEEPRWLKNHNQIQKKTFSVLVEHNQAELACLPKQKEQMFTKSTFYHKTLHFIMNIRIPMQHFVNKIGIIALAFLSCKLHMVAKVLQSHHFCEFCLQNELTHIHFGDTFIIKCNFYEQNCVKL